MVRLNGILGTSEMLGMRMAGMPMFNSAIQSPMMPMLRGADPTVIYENCLHAQASFLTPHRPRFNRGCVFTGNTGGGLESKNSITSTNRFAKLVTASALFTAFGLPPAVLAASEVLSSADMGFLFLLYAHVALILKIFINGYINGAINGARHN